MALNVLTKYSEDLTVGASLPIALSDCANAEPPSFKESDEKSIYKN